MADTLPTPASRREQFLNAVATGDPTGLPEPASRKEVYLATAAGIDGLTLPEPASREEEYLKAIAENGGGGGGGSTKDYGTLTLKKRTAVSLIKDSGTTITFAAPAAESQLKYYEWAAKHDCLSYSYQGTSPSVSIRLACNADKYPLGEWWFAKGENHLIEVSRTELIALGATLSVTVPASSTPQDAVYRITNEVFSEEPEEYQITDEIAYNTLGWELPPTYGGGVGTWYSPKLDNGDYIDRATIVGYQFGKDCNYIPDGFLGFCYHFNSELTLPSSITKIPEAFLYRCHDFDSDIHNMNNIVSIGVSMLSNCMKFNKQLDLSNVEIIDRNFLNGATKYNQELNMPKLKSIGGYFLQSCSTFNKEIHMPLLETLAISYFMSGCTAFACPLEINATTLNPGNNYKYGNFMYDCREFKGPLTVAADFPDWMTTASSQNNCLSTTSNTAVMYTTGVTIKGAGRTSWITALPDRTSSPFRKLIDGGE